MYGGSFTNFQVENITIGNTLLDFQTLPTTDSDPKTPLTITNWQLENVSCNVSCQAISLFGNATNPVLVDSFSYINSNAAFFYSDALSQNIQLSNIEIQNIHQPYAYFYLFDLEFASPFVNISLSNITIDK